MRACEWRVTFAGLLHTSYRILQHPVCKDAAASLAQCCSAHLTHPMHSTPRLRLISSAFHLWVCIHSGRSSATPAFQCNKMARIKLCAVAFMLPSQLLLSLPSQTDNTCCSN